MAAKRFPKSFRKLGAIGAALVLAPFAAAQTRLEYSASQAAEGKGAFTQACASCHGAYLDDGEFGPPLRGARFMDKWGAKSADKLFSYMTSKMPPDRPNSLGAPVYAQILAYLLESNKVPAGANPVPADEAVLAKMNLPPGPSFSPGGGLTSGVGLPAMPKKASPLDRITPVTDAMLAAPPASEWLTWRRTLDDQGFSPLKQITKANVSGLHLAWAWTLPTGANEATPLVHDGVMFVHGFGDRVQALDAATGDLLWEYSRLLPAGLRPTVKRNLSIYGDKIYVGTSDVHLIALNIKTGKVAWDSPIGDPKVGFGLTGGPLAAKGKVMIGTNGRAPGKNYIVAFDAETGKEAWRFNTIAQPGEPGGDSWNGLPVEKRNGASAWVAGSYDPTLNLVYWGVAQTYDTGPLRNLVKRPGITNEGLYTDSTLALNPDTGKLVWYFQHLKNDQWDLDWVFERVIAKLPVGGVTKSVVLTSGKQAIYDAVDAETGKYDFSIDLGLQNVITSIDPKTGEKTIDPKTVPGDGEAKMVCPHAGGAKSWLPESYNPVTKIMYVPLVESCMDLFPVEAGGRGFLSTGVGVSIRPRPDTDGKYGRVEAINMITHKPVWTERHRAPESTGVLDTAGGVVFSGAIDRYFRAFDDANGKLLWEARLGDVPSNAPITFSANGKQYVAVGVGNGGAQASTFPVLVPEIHMPERAAAIWVFELPDKR